MYGIEMRPTVIRNIFLLLIKGPKYYKFLHGTADKELLYQLHNFVLEASTILFINTSQFLNVDHIT